MPAAPTSLRLRRVKRGSGATGRPWTGRARLLMCRRDRVCQALCFVASFMSLSASAAMPAAAPRRESRLGAVRAWLWIVAALVFLMVVVGGATRLTESGLSITEWNLVTGVVPPL